MRLSATTVVYASGRLADALCDLRAEGYDGVELQPHHTLPLLEGPEAARGLHQALDDQGLALAAVMIGYLFDEKSLEAHVRTVEIAADLGGEVVVVLPPRTGGIGLERFGELVATLSDRAEPTGVKVAVHHHAGTVIATEDDWLALWGGAPSAAGLCFDSGHYALYANDEVAALERSIDRTSHVHLKDLISRTPLAPPIGARDASRLFRSPGDGDLDMAGCVRVLDEHAYGGWLSVEIENFNRLPRESLRVSRSLVMGAVA